MTKKDKARELLKENPDLGYREIKEKCGYSSLGTAHRVRRDVLDEMGRDDQETQTEATEATEKTDSSDSHDTMNDNTDTKNERIENVEVNENKGSEKLKPDNNPNINTTNIDPPEGVTNEATPGDFEAGKVFNNHDETDEPDETTEDIINETDDPAERERREQVVNSLDEGLDKPTPETPESPEKSVNLEIDEDVIGNLIGQPYTQLAATTQWDGWELTDEEKATTAKLIKQWAEENNVDLGINVMLLLQVSMMTSGRVIRYRQHKNQSQTQSQSQSQSQQTQSKPTTKRGDELIKENRTEETEDSFNPDNW